MEVKDCIKIYDNALDVFKISSIIKWANNSQFEKATIITDNKIILDESTRKVEELGLFPTHSSLTNVHWYNYLKNNCHLYLNKYCQDLNLNYGNQRASVGNSCYLSILKYIDNGFYHYHVDHGELSSRTISMIFMLNDDYEGGELCFINPNGSGQEMKVKAKSGRLIMWPSNFMYPHRVAPVTKGIRFTVVGWLV